MGHEAAVLEHRWRPPNAGELLEVANARSGSDEFVLLRTEQARMLIEQIFEAPAVDEPGLDAQRRFVRRLYRVARKLFQLPFASNDGCAIVAWAVRATIERSGGTCVIGEVAMALWLRSWRSQPRQRPFEDWLVQSADFDGVVIPRISRWSTRVGGHDRPLAWPGIGAADAHLSMPTIYVICSVAQPCAEGREVAVLQDADEICRGVSAALAALDYPMVRVVHLGVQAVTEQRTPTEWAALVQRELLNADAYVLIEPLSFGAGFEVAGRRRDAGSVLVVKDAANRVHSRLLDALVEEGGVWSDTLTNWSGLAGAVAEWLYVDFEAVLSANRRRTNQEILYTPQRVHLAKAVHAASNAALRSALKEASIAPWELRLAMDNAQGWARLNGPRLRRFGVLLAGSTAVPLAKAEPERLDLAELEIAAKANDWDDRFKARLLMRARKMLEAAPSRFALRTAAQWVDFAERLR